MRLVVNTSRIIASLIKDSVCREIILSDRFVLFTPLFSVTEIEKYRDYICNKARIDQVQFYNILFELLEHIFFVKDSTIKPYLKKADQIIGSVDKKDVPFIASALSVRNSAIWSDDKDFEKQKIVKIFKTKDLIRF